MNIKSIIKNVNKGAYEPINEDLMILRSLSEENHIPIIRRNTESFIGALIDSAKPKRILEIGSAIGYSALYMATKAPQAEIISIEKDKYAAATAEYNIKTYGSTQNIHLMIGDGTKVLDKLITNKTEPFDLLFIDAGKSHYIEFFERIINLSKKGTVILSDDISQRGGLELLEDAIPRKHRTSIRNMQEFIQFLKENKSIENHFTEIGDGLAISIVRG